MSTPPPEIPLSDGSPTDRPSRPNRRRLALLIAPFALVLLALVAVQVVESRRAAEAPISSIPPIPTPTPGPAPLVALPLLDGPEVTLEAWRGRGVILNFWATWCYPCRVEMPVLADAHRESGGLVEVIGVNEAENSDLARAFVDEYAIPFPILLDDDGALGDAFGILGLPTTYFIDPEGQVLGMHLGPLDSEELAEWVQRLKP